MSIEIGNGGSLDVGAIEGFNFTTKRYLSTVQFGTVKVQDYDGDCSTACTGIGALS